MYWFLDLKPTVLLTIVFPVIEHEAKNWKKQKLQKVKKNEKWKMNTKQKTKEIPVD